MNESAAHGPVCTLPLSAEEAAAAHSALWCLLSERAAQYTHGESSSIPIETATELLNSLCFTLGLNKIPASIRQFLQLGPGESYTQGIQRLKGKTVQGRSLWVQVQENLPALSSLSLTDTMHSLGSCWQQYDIYFFAHQFPADIDYQLSQSVPESFQSIDYAIEYLRRLLLECIFLRQFDPHICAGLLSTCCGDYNGLLVNLFEPVAINALGLILAGEEPKRLDISQAHRTKILEILAPLPRFKMQEALKNAADQLCLFLHFYDKRMRCYLQNLAASLYPRIELGLALGDLSAIFTTIDKTVGAHGRRFF